MKILRLKTDDFGVTRSSPRYSSGSSERTSLHKNEDSSIENEDSSIENEDSSMILR